MMDNLPTPTTNPIAIILPIVGVFVLIGIIGCCCYRRQLKKRGEERDLALSEATYLREGDVEAVNQARQQLHATQQSSFKLQKGDEDFVVTDMYNVQIFKGSRENSMSWKIMDNSGHSLASIVDVDVTGSAHHQIYQAGKQVGDLYFHPGNEKEWIEDHYTFQMLSNGEIWHIKGRFIDHEYNFRKYMSDGIQFASVSAPMGQSFKEFYRLDILPGNDVLLILSCVFAIHSTARKPKPPPPPPQQDQDQQDQDQQDQDQQDHHHHHHQHRNELILVPGEKDVPKHAVKGSQNDGGDYWCAISHSQYGKIPGKAQGKRCWFSWGGKEHITDKFEWIGNAKLVKNNIPPPMSARVGNQHDSGYYYAVIAHTEWGDIPGKAKENCCWFPYGGEERNTNNFSWVVPRK